MKLWDSLLTLLFPKVCPLCGNASEDNGLCRECRTAYARETFLRCPNCGETAGKCVCGTDFAAVTKTRIGEMPHFSLTFYLPANQSGEERVTERMIFRLKERGEFADFFAGECARELNRRFEASGERIGDWTLTYAPRSTAKFLEYGVDQGEEVCRRTAKLLGCPFEKLFVRTRTAAEQKGLGEADRKVNAEESLIVRQNRVTPGGKYLLFDDIITSGATMSTAAQLLYENGAGAVFPFAIARTLPRKR